MNQKDIFKNQLKSAFSDFEAEVAATMAAALNK